MGLALAAACSEPETDVEGRAGRPSVTADAVEESVTGGGEFEHPSSAR
jgi:hypothetical protein